MRAHLNGRLRPRWWQSGLMKQASPLRQRARIKKPSQPRRQISAPNAFQSRKPPRSSLGGGATSNNLEYVATKPCLVCGRAPSDAHHLRYAEPRALGRKVSDEFAVPLCRIHHRELHDRGDEKAWWEGFSIDPNLIAEQLWSETR